MQPLLFVIARSREKWWPINLLVEIKLRYHLWQNKIKYEELPKEQLRIWGSFTKVLYIQSKYFIWYMEQKELKFLFLCSVFLFWNYLAWLQYRINEVIFTKQKQCWAPIYFMQRKPNSIGKIAQLFCCLLLTVPWKKNLWFLQGFLVLLLVSTKFLNRYQ